MEIVLLLVDLIALDFRSLSVFRCVLGSVFFGSV